MEINDTTVKDITNRFRLNKENEAIKNRIIRDIRNLFEHEEEDSYKSLRVGNFWTNNYIKYESNGDKNKTPSVKKNLNKIRPHLKDIINDVKKSDTWKIQVKIAINFIFSKDSNEECVMHSKSDNIQTMINDKAEEVIQELFESLLNR